MSEREPLPEPGEDGALEDWEEDTETETAEVADTTDDAAGAGGEDAGGDVRGADDGATPGAATPAARYPRVKPTGANERFQNLSNENRALRERLERLEQQQTQPRQPTAAEQQQREAEEEQNFLAQIQNSMLDPHLAQAQIAQFYNQRTERRVAAAIRTTEFNTWDATDRGSYERELAANPRLGRFTERVEELRRQAPGVSRLDLLDKAIGEATRRNIGAARSRQQNAAAAQNGAGGARPARTGNTVQNPRTQPGARRGWEHLRNIQI